ncbi:MAG: GerMN domain-containing protein [Deltaproteobacteria bacterium]|nr:GerMN domain-containing protein [Deltaproteobacteria bacterium]
MGLRLVSKRQSRLWLLLLVAIGLGFAAAFFLGKLFFPTTESVSPSSRVRNSIPVREAITRKIHLYFANQKGNYLQAEERKIVAEDTISAMEAIVTALMEGPDDPKLVSTIPPGSRLLHIFVTDDGTAYLDFSSELSRLHPGGVTAERLTLYAIVNSLVLNLEQVERVQLLFEGQPASTLCGHLDIRQAKTANLLIVR